MSVQTVGFSLGIGKIKLGLVRYGVNPVGAQQVRNRFPNSFFRPGRCSFLSAARHCCRLSPPPPAAACTSPPRPSASRPSYFPSSSADAALRPLSSPLFRQRRRRDLTDCHPARPSRGSPPPRCSSKGSGDRGGITGENQRGESRRSPVITGDLPAGSSTSSTAGKPAGSEVRLIFFAISTARRDELRAFSPSPQLAHLFCFLLRVARTLHPSVMLKVSVLICSIVTTAVHVCLVADRLQ